MGGWWGSGPVPNPRQSAELCKAQARCDRNEWNFERDGQRMDEGDHISTTDARAGSTPHMTRYILGWGLGLVIIAFIVILFIWR